MVERICGRVMMMKIMVMNCCVQDNVNAATTDYIDVGLMKI